MKKSVVRKVNKPKWRNSAKLWSKIKREKGNQYFADFSGYGSDLWPVIGAPSKDAFCIRSY